VNPGEAYPELVAAAFPMLGSHNIAVNGAYIDNESQGAAADALFDSTKRFNICAVAFGANDGLQGSAATFNANLAAFVAARVTRGFLPMVMTMLPCGSYDSVAFRAAINLNSRNDRNYSRGLTDLGDIQTTMGAEAAKNDGSLYGDTVHPTAAGHALLAAIVKPLVTRLLC